jgi:hypothetical protein
MKIKELIEKLKGFPDDLEVVGAKFYYDAPMGKYETEYDNEFDIQTKPLLKTKYGAYSDCEIFVGGKAITTTTETVLIFYL